MYRRRFLATAGIGGLAGCLGRSGTADRTPSADRDGYPPAPATTPDERAIDVDSFETVSVRGVDVPLVPVDVAQYWHQRREARFADARGRTQYERSHILGAVLSTAPDGVANDPVAAWPADDRIVCYCGCPHHLSSLRAASLSARGYDRVYVIDEGFWAWVERDYPIEGTRVDSQPRLRVVHGRVDPTYAGTTVLAVHQPSDQWEATRVATDGTYTLHLRFAGLTDGATLTLHLPERTVHARLGDLVRS